MLDKEIKQIKQLKTACDLDAKRQDQLKQLKRKKSPK